MVVVHKPHPSQREKGLVMLSQSSCPRGPQLSNIAVDNRYRKLSNNKCNLRRAWIWFVTSSFCRGDNSVVTAWPDPSSLRRVCLVRLDSHLHFCDQIKNLDWQLSPMIVCALLKLLSAWFTNGGHTSLEWSVDLLEFVLINFWKVFQSQEYFYRLCQSGYMSCLLPPLRARGGLIPQCTGCSLCGITEDLCNYR